jgi:hypothetical protein
MDEDTLLALLSILFVVGGASLCVLAAWYRTEEDENGYFSVN